MASQPQPTTCTHLVLVCCHATYRGVGDPNDKTSWILQDFQKSNPSTGKQGEHLTFLEHIHAAAAIVARDPNALLLFSGGKTQSLVDLSEAESYRRVYEIKHDAVDAAHGHQIKINTEPHATDSYQNLLFSLLRFKILTTSYPSRVTLITHAFKSQRFLELHGSALKFPAEKLRVLGMNPPFTRDELEDVQEGERVRGYEPFERDLYGVKEVLGGKRRGRGWRREVSGTLAGGLEEEVGRLLEWDGGESGREVFGEKLPWEGT